MAGLLRARRQPPPAAHRPRGAAPVPSRSAPHALARAGSSAPGLHALNTTVPFMMIAARDARIAGLRLAFVCCAREFHGMAAARQATRVQNDACAHQSRRSPLPDRRHGVVSGVAPAGLCPGPCGRWHEAGDRQSRAPTTFGATNRHLNSTAVAMITYDASAVRDWLQPVRYSAYPRNLDTQLEQFGHEKDGSFADEGEVHLRTGCPIPSRDHIKLAMISGQGRGRQEIVDGYGGAGIIEW